jgi:uncharacterized protein (TIGR03089 family)
VDLPAPAARPLLTYYDDATGERVALSAVELGGWASRTAGLLHAGCGLGVGDRMAVLAPPHWQTAAVLLGAWSAGLSVSFRLAATDGLPVLEPAGDLGAVFVSHDRLTSWLTDVPPARYRFVVGLPAAVAVPDGCRDFVAEVGGYPDSLVSGYAPIWRGDAATVDGTSFGEWGALALELAEVMGMRPGDRVLVDSGEHEHPVKWLLAPLSVGASVVLCANLDPAALPARVEAEEVTRVL